MGIDAMGGGQHLALSLAAQRAEGCKGLRGRAVRCFPPCPGAGLKIRVEGGRAAHKGKRIHIGVAAAVPAIHQAGLGGSGHLIQKGPHRLPGSRGGIQRIHRLGKDRRRPGRSRLREHPAAAAPPWQARPQTRHLRPSRCNSSRSTFLPSGRRTSMSNSRPSGLASSTNVVSFLMVSGSASST